MEKRIEEFLTKRKEENLLRHLTEISPIGGGKILAGGKEYINFSSNDYLALSSHPKLAKKAQEALCPIFGSSASRLMTGSTSLHHELEERIASFKGKEAGLVFNSGYQANVGIISALANKRTCIFADKLSHASIIDGIILSGAKLFRFHHNDMGHLEELLHKHRKDYAEALVVTETVFSMDGDISPLKEIVKLKEKYGAYLMVDEAHATGIFGENGSGIVEETGLANEVDIIMGTFSKALGSFGAYAATSALVRDFLINTSRSFIYSTALPPVVIAANLAALDLVRDEPHRRRKLLEISNYFRDKLKKKGFTVLGSSQIIPIIVGDSKTVLHVSDTLRKKGYWVTPVRPPTVPQGQSRLRISLTYDHDKKTLDRFIEDISEL